MYQNSDTFAVWDALDGVVALAWEDMTDYDEYPDSRVSFRFGETIKDTEDRLYENDLILNYNMSRNGKLKEDDKD